MDWKTALKVAGPSAIAAWVFVRLIERYLDHSEIIKTNIYLNFVLLIVIFAFCMGMGVLWIRSGKATPEDSKTESTDSKKNIMKVIEDNEIEDNKVDGDASIGRADVEIKRNKIKRNKIKGNLDIGGKQ